MLQYKAIQFKEQQIQRKMNPWSGGGLWLHQGQAFVYVQKVTSNTQIKDISRFDFDQKNHLIALLTAKQGLLKNDVWQLNEVDMTRFTPTQTTTEHYQQLPLNFTFQPELLQKRLQLDPDQQTISQLWTNIRYRKQAGLLASELESGFWARVLQPLTTVVMICLGVPFIFGSLRSASVGARILTGIIVGFVFYMLNQFLGPIALVYQWPEWIGGALPMVFFLIIYAIMLSRVK